MCSWYRWSHFMGGTMLVTRKKKIQFWPIHRQVELEPDPPRNNKKRTWNCWSWIGKNCIWNWTVGSIKLKKKLEPKPDVLWNFKKSCNRDRRFSWELRTCQDCLLPCLQLGLFSNWVAWPGYRPLVDSCKVDKGKNNASLNPLLSPSSSEN